jgi:STE24 endopeptidase
MKNFLPWFAFGTCVCLVLLCLVFFNIQNGELAKTSQPHSQNSAQPGNSQSDTSPVAVPEPSPKAVSFYHDIMLFIAVFISWNLLIPAVFLFTGFSAKLRSWAERVGRRWYFSYAIYCTAFSLIYFLLLLPLAYYGGFILLHHYDLSNQSMARWLSCSAKGAAVQLLIG